MPRTSRPALSWLWRLAGVAAAPALAAAAALPAQQRSANGRVAVALQASDLEPPPALVPVASSAELFAAGALLPASSAPPRGNAFHGGSPRRAALLRRLVRHRPPQQHRTGASAEDGVAAAPAQHHVAGAAMLLELSWRSQAPLPEGGAAFHEPSGSSRAAAPLAPRHIALCAAAAAVGLAAWFYARQGKDAAAAKKAGDGGGGSVAETQPADAAPGSQAAGCWLVTLLCAVSAVEGADIALLPASMFALQRDLGLRPGQLATMALWQALFEAAAAPLWGVLADRRVLSRRAILVLGCAGWGLITAMLATLDAFGPMVVLRAVNGVLLASLRPICNGLVPDVVEETRRGRVYGLIALSTNVGGMAGGMVVTPVSTTTVAGVQGWRVAFVVVGALCLGLSALVAATMQEPPRGGCDAAGAARDEGAAEKSSATTSAWQAAKEELERLTGYFRIPTFTFIVSQGLFGMIPWNALGYITLFLQTAGLSSYEAAFVVALGKATQSVGCLLGGILGDAAAERYPDHGRACVAQASVLAGIPCIWLLFAVSPPDEASEFAWYSTTYAALGLVATWCAAGVNWPVFTEIVPPEGRTAIVAWDTALEGISGAVFGNLAVTFLAEHCFGYVLPAAGSTATAAWRDPSNAMALGKALAWSTTVPFLICLTIYSAMHWSYPRDVRRCRAMAAAASARAIGAPSPSS